MKIAIIRSFYAPVKIKSYNSQEIGLGQGLLQKNISVDIYSRFSELYNIVEYETNGEAKLRLIPLHGVVLGKVAYFPGLIKLLSKGDYDVIQINGDQNLMTPLIMKARIKNQPIKILYQGMYAGSKGLGKIYNFLFDQIFLKAIQTNVDIVMTKTQEARSFLQGKLYEHVQLQPIGLDFNRMIDNQSENEEVTCFSKRFKNTLLYVGILEPRRDLLFVIDVLKGIVCKAGDGSCGIVIVGQGPSLSLIKDKVKALSLEENVLFISSVPNDEIGSIYKKCDMFLLPSHYEIYGMVVMEALLFGMPVISSPTAGPNDILNDSELGELVDFDVDIWVDTILKYCSSKYMSSEYKEKRGRFILVNYSWDHLATNYLKIVNRYVENNTVMRKGHAKL